MSSVQLSSSSDTGGESGIIFYTHKFKCELYLVMNCVRFGGKLYIITITFLYHICEEIVGR